MKTTLIHEAYILTVFPCAIEYGDESALDSFESTALYLWLDWLQDKAKEIHPDANVYFEYGEGSEFETCDILNTRGNCVAVKVTALYPEDQP